MPIHTKLTFVKQAKPADTMIVIGRLSRLKRDSIYKEWNVDQTIWLAMLNRLNPGDNSAIESTWVGERKIIIGALPENCSRHNTPTRTWGIDSIMAQGANRKGSLSIVCLVEDSHVDAIAMSVAKTFPLYNRSSGKKISRNAEIEFRDFDGSIEKEHVQYKMEAIREAAMLVDIPCSELYVSHFLK